MAVEALSPEGTSAGNPPAVIASRPPRRRRLPVLVILIVVAFLASFAAYLANYMPMFPANGTAGGGVSSVDLGTFVSPKSDEQFAVSEYSYQRGGRFWFGFGLRNDGPIGVSVRSIDSRLPGPHDFDGLAQQRGVWIASSDGWYGPPGDKRSESFRPFWLGAGQERWVVIEIQFRDCPVEGSGGGGTLVQFLRGAYLSYRVLGLPRHGFMPYPTVIHLKGPSLDPDC